jgi:hypothetical protein
MNDCLPIGTFPNYVHRYVLVYGWHLYQGGWLHPFRLPRSEMLGGGKEL